VKARGGKIIHYHGLSDPLIVPFGSQSYVSRLFQRYGVAATQSFMRSFFYPGNGHCGGGAAPLINSTDLFAALVDWVESGVAPDYIVARQNLGGGVTRSRKICKYPDEAAYTGAGSTDDQASFRCDIHAAEPADLAAASATARQSLGEGAEATVWVGLKNTDDIGTRFDVRVELYSGTALVGAGEALCVTGVARNAARAVTVPLAPTGPGASAQEPLSVKVWARIGTTASGGLCGGHGSAVGLRLYYDGSQQPSGVRTALAPGSVADFFLRANAGRYVPDTAAPTAPVSRPLDSAALTFTRGNAWRLIGTWAE